MTALTEVFVTVKPDTEKFGPEVKRKLAKIDSKKEGAQIATRFGLGFNGAIGGIISRSAGVFAAGFAALKVGGFLKDAVGQASDLGETMSKSATVFGKSNTIIQQFAKNAPRALGQTKQEAIGAAAQFGNMFTQLGIGQKQAAGMSTQMVQLASDFASFHNADVSEVLEAQQAAFRGEFDSIQKFVPTINAAAVEQQALKMHLAGSTKELTDQDKALAVQSLLMSGAGKATGDFARTSGGLANQQRILSAQFSDFKTSVGQVALPLVTKFVSFLNDRGVPILQTISNGAAGLASAFSGEGVTSDGFVGFMERIGVVARDVFDFFKAEVLPRLKDFGSFVKNEAAPAIATFATNLATTLGPAVKDVFGFFKSEVLPRLQDFGSFLGDKVLPKVGEMATSLSKNKDFLVPFAATIVTIIAALKTWAIVQGILNVVMSANPIGLVVVAIAALVGGLIYAYKHSERFRAILQGAFAGIQKAAQIFAPLVKAAIDIVIGVFSLWWNYYAKPILKGFGAALAVAWGLAQKFSLIVIAGFNAIKAPAFAAIKFVIDRFLGFVQDILIGASKAFGWVPGLGPKLKAAATEFGKFRNNVNAALAGVQDQQINFTIKYTNTGVNLSTPSSVGRRAGGGPGGQVFGPGSTTSDSVGPYMLSNREWVIKASSSQRYGDKAMASINAGTATVIPGFATGGRPGLNPRLIADSSGLARSVKAVVFTAAASAARQLAKSGGGLMGTMAFGRSQVGKPYIWGASGPNGYDCSGFVSALINYARGRNPYSRLGATGSMPWADMAPGAGRFMVGWFKGNPGHTAATINGVNFESRGGRGVVVGAGARGAYDGLFTNRAKVRGFANGGKAGDLPFDLIDPRGKNFQGKNFLRSLGIDDFDTGGRWRSGTLGVNLSGRTETVLPGDGQMELAPKSIEALADAIARRPTLLDGRRIDDAVSRRALSY